MTTESDVLWVISYTILVGVWLLGIFNSLSLAKRNRELRSQVEKLEHAINQQCDEVDYWMRRTKEVEKHLKEHNKER